MKRNVFRILKYKPSGTDYFLHLVNDIKSKLGRFDTQHLGNAPFVNSIQTREGYVLSLDNHAELDSYKIVYKG